MYPHQNFDRYTRPPGQQRFFAPNMLPHGYAYGYANQPQPQYPCYQNIPLAAPTGTTEYFGQNVAQGLVPNMAGAGPAAGAQMGMMPPGSTPPRNELANTPMQHPGQQQRLMHQNLSGLPTQHIVSNKTREKKGIPIINPHTGKEIEIEQSSSQSQSSGDTSERQTPQPMNRIVEEFSNKVKEAANEVTPVEKITRQSFSEAPPLMTNIDAEIVNPININLIKTETIPFIETKKPDIVPELNDTPEVSAISDSPVVVPKIGPASLKHKEVKEPEKVIEPTPPSIVDSDKNKKPKQNKQANKPAVPPPEEKKIVEPASPATLPRGKKHGKSKGKGKAQTPLKGENKEDSNVEVKPQEPTTPDAAVTSKPVFAPSSVSMLTPSFAEPASSLKQSPAPATAPVSSSASVLTPSFASAAAPIPSFASAAAPMPSFASAAAPMPSFASAAAPMPSFASAAAPMPSFAAAPMPSFASAAAPMPSFASAAAPAACFVTEDSLAASFATAASPVASFASAAPPVASFAAAASPGASFAAAATPGASFVATVAPVPSPASAFSSASILTPSFATMPVYAAAPAIAPEPPLQKQAQKKSPSPPKPSVDRDATPKPEVEKAKTPKETTPDSKTQDPASEVPKEVIQTSEDTEQKEITNNEYQDETKKDVNMNEKSLLDDQDAENGNSQDSKTNKINARENSKDKSPPNQDTTDPTTATDDTVNSNVDEKSADDDEIIDKEDDDVAEETPEPEKEKVTVPKYRYNDDQWSPSNPSGKKSYDKGFLMQLRDDPKSRKLPDNMHMLDLVARPEGSDVQVSLTNISRPNSDSFLPQFAIASGPMRGPPRDAKRGMPQGRSMSKGQGSTSQLAPHKPVIHVNLSLRGDVKLNESENAWKPTRLKKPELPEDETATQELYKKFRGILNKLTPEKFARLLEQVKSLEINTQERLKGVIDLIFEKAIDEPSFSETYALMCQKLSTLMVPADNSDQNVNFRVLIITKCQAQFQTTEVQEDVVRLEKELAESTDPAKQKELQLQLDEENRKIRMRSVGNIRFIGELYKLKMLTAKIMVNCMNDLVTKLEEEKLECLCKLLTTIGQQVEGDAKDQLDNIFKKMQDIAGRKSKLISSRVRFMIQDVVDLRRRRWAVKSGIDSKPKTMDQIQKEAEEKQRHIEMMNAGGGGGGGGGYRGDRRDDGGRGKRDDGRRGDSKRGDSRRDGGQNYMDNSWQVSTRGKSYTVDTSKLKAAGNLTKNVGSIKLGPPVHSGWNMGARSTSAGLGAGAGMALPTNTNMYSVLETSAADPTTLRGKTESPARQHSKGASIERSTFAPKTDFSPTPGRAGPSDLTRSSSTSASPPVPEPVAVSTPQEPLSESEKKLVKATFEQCCLVNPSDEELVSEIKERFKPTAHAGIVNEVLNAVWELKPTTYPAISKSLLHLVTTNLISAENFLSGIAEHFEFAPDLHIDIPKLYDYLAMFVAPHIVNKHITLEQILTLSEIIISQDQGATLLQALFNELKTLMGPTFVANIWRESGHKLSQWMSEEQAKTFIKDKNLEYITEGGSPTEESPPSLSPAQLHAKLLELMNTGQTYDCIKNWIKDNVGQAVAEESFIRVLIQAICEFALFGPEGKARMKFSQERMTKYINMINEFGLSKSAVESNCLLGIQQLIHRLEHPQGVTLEIFQYLSEMYISQEGFLEWEKSDSQPEGKGVMLKALTSFFTDIKEAENEDSGSED